ncbi:hypothetical protein JD844_013257 [Phrynosoma platyrhinos]|uniref:SEFIR domain-containing protein n=1 Tax=Phrynosoma platyrhinos TaxID=52577 RepID=A0ABQ7TKM4_PHRPL|nr:hypothetical protein JD844_013257 [Phrynosoma platyrhinos]
MRIMLFHVTKGLNCQLLEKDVLCIPGERVPDPEFGPVLVLTEMTMRNKLQCQEHQNCIPCVQVMLHLRLLEILRTHILLSAYTYPSSYCVAVEAWIPYGQPDWHNSTLIAPENVSLPISKVFPCLCLQVHLPISDTEALSRAWAESHLDVKVFNGILSCSFSAPCDLPGELVPCWRGEELACHPLHPQLRMDLILHELQEFPGLRPHPKLCVQGYLRFDCFPVSISGELYVTAFTRPSYLSSHVLQLTHYGPDIKGNHNSFQHLLFWTTLDFQGNFSVHVLEQGSWVPLAQAVSTRNGILEEALQNDMHSGECMLDIMFPGNHRTHWVLAWMITFLGLSSIVFVLLLKKEALKGVLQGHHILILYSPDHKAFERLVGTLAGALTQLQLSVSLELWSRGELGSLGPMQWLHAQRHQVLEAGGTILLLFSPGAVAGCAEWLGWKQTDTLPPIKPDNTFLASLNCILPDFQAGKSRGKYIVACFEELLAVNEIPGLFHSVPVYPLPSQLLSFLLALAGPGVSYEQRSSLRRHAVWISKSLERAVLECQQNKASWQYSLLLPDHCVDGQIKGNDGHSFIVS